MLSQREPIVAEANRVIAAPKAARGLVAMLSIGISMLALAACDDEPLLDSPGLGPLEPLARHLPVEDRAGQYVASIDLEAGREQVDAEPNSTGGPVERIAARKQSDRRLAGLYSVASGVIPWLATTPGNEEVGAVVDVDAISAAVSALEEIGKVVVISTRQDFGQISRGLIRRGFRTKDGVLVAPPGHPRSTAGIGAVSGLGSGMVVMAEAPEAVRAGIEQDDIDPVVALLGDVAGVARSAARDDNRDACVRELGVGQDVQPPQMHVRLGLAESADSDRLTIPERELPSHLKVDVDRVQVSGNELIADASFELVDTPGNYSAGVGAPGPPGYGPDAFYDC